MNRTETPRAGNAAVLLTFAAGAAAGALLLALASPRTGARLPCGAEDLGRRLRDKAADVTDRAKGAWEEVKEGVAEEGDRES